MAGHAAGQDWDHLRPRSRGELAGVHSGCAGRLALGGFASHPSLTERESPHGAAADTILSRSDSGGTATPYRYLEHTADAGIEATGATIEEAFASAADGLAGWLCDSASVSERESRPFDLAAADLESLLVDWLNEVNFAFEVDRFAFRRFEVKQVRVPAALREPRGPPDARTAPGGGPVSLTATGYGEPLDPARHHPGEQVKSVTYHGVRVEETPQGWLARVLMDI